MKQKDFLKFLSLGLLFLILVFVSVLMPAKGLQQKKSSVSSKIVPSNLRGASLQFSPNSITKGVGDKVEVDIIIDSGKKVTAADLTIVFDPKKINIMNIKEGEFFEKPIILNKEINNVAGKLNLAIGGFSGKQGRGKLISLTLKLKTATNGLQPAILNFSPKTAIAAIGSPESVLISTNQLKITILP